MALVTKTRSKEIFEQYLQSEATKKSYTYNIDRFVEFNHLESWDSILELDAKKLTEMMEDFVIMFKTSGKSQSYTSNYVFAVQSLCDSNDKIGINWKKIRRLLGKKQRPKKTRPYTREEIKRMLHSTKSLKNKAVLLFLSSSGVRRGALPPLRMRDLKEMPHGCIQVTVYAGDNEEYITFINKEATQALNLFIKKRKHQGETITLTITEKNCDSSYPDFCIPSPPPDLDCGDISQKRFTVLQPDPHRFDGNKDGIGCES